MEGNMYLCGIMKEELTTKMHGEFSVDSETEIKHKIWGVMNAAQTEPEINYYLRVWELTREQFNKHRKSFPTDHPFKEKGLQ